LDPIFTVIFAKLSKYSTLCLLLSIHVVPSSLSFHYFHYLTHSVFAKLYRSARLSEGLRAAAQVFKKASTSTSAKTFRSRSRRAQSVDVEFPVGPDSAKREYAIERRLLEAPVLDLSYYVDIVGVVPVEPRSTPREEHDIGNGDTSPEWGLDLVLHGGFLRYGPWADRQRSVPSSYPPESVLIGDGCIGPSCSAYFFLRRTKKRIGLIISGLVIIAFGLLCEYSSSFAAGQRYTYPSAKGQRYFAIEIVSGVVVSKCA
jgi:hypothetical protein